MNAAVCHECHKQVKINNLSFDGYGCLHLFLECGHMREFELKEKLVEG